MDHICYDILFHIFEYLDLNDVINVRLVSTQFDYVYDDNLLWKTYFVKDYDMKHGDLYELFTQINYKNIYKKCHDINILKYNFDINKSIIYIMKMQIFYSSDGNITKISPEIKHLINLREIYLHKNHIKKYRF